MCDRKNFKKYVQNPRVFFRRVSSVTWHYSMLMFQALIQQETQDILKLGVKTSGDILNIGCRFKYCLRRIHIKGIPYVWRRWGSNMCLCHLKDFLASCSRFSPFLFISQCGNLSGCVTCPRPNMIFRCTETELIYLSASHISRRINEREIPNSRYKLQASMENNSSGL